MTDKWIKSGPILHRTESLLPVGRNKWTFRFRGRFNVTPSGCFELVGNQDKDGYGHLSYRNKSIAAHRLSWILRYGEIPFGLQVCHKCDNPKCINPMHLFLGTTQDNTSDRHNKERDARGKKQAFTKLSETDVIQMREDYFQKGKTLKTISKKFGVCSATAREAIQGINWKWI